MCSAVKTVHSATPFTATDIKPQNIGVSAVKYSEWNGMAAIQPWLQKCTMWL